MVTLSDAIVNREKAKALVRASVVLRDTRLLESANRKLALADEQISAALRPEE